MAHKWSEIRRTLSPEQEEETRQYVKSVVEAVTLNQLREARSLTQASLASILGVNQGSVSKMEKRTDMYVSTLRRFIQAMGGQLQVKAVFPEGEVQIDQFENAVVSSKESNSPADSNSEAAA
jgi:DNA-binding XRE family transcriptional regulator